MTRAAWLVLGPALGLLATHGLLSQPRPVADSRISHLTAVSATTVPRYGRYEARFDVAIPYEVLPAQAAPCRGLTPLAGQPGHYPPNRQLPYVPTSPVWIRHAFMSEDARLGVSVDALLTPPDHGKTIDQPCFWEEGYDQDLHPTGERDWRLRFSPNVVGRWHYKIRVSDSRGTSESPEQTFTVTPSPSHGFVRVAPTDTRYFAFTDGTTFLPAATYGADSDIQSIAAQGAYGWVRYWLTNIGLTNSQTAGDGMPFQGERMTRTFAADTGLQQDIKAIDPDAQYHYRGWIKLGQETLTLPGPYVIQFGKYAGPSTQDNLQATSDWQPFSIPVSGSGPWGNHWGYDLHVDYTNSAGDLVPVTAVNHLARYGLYDDATGEAVSDGSDNDVTDWSQIDWAIVDQSVALAETSSPRQYLKVTCFRHDQAPGWDNINSDAETVPSSQENLYGGGTFRMDGSTPNQTFQADFARCFMAREGYSPSVAAVEYDNESNPSDGAVLPFTDTFGAALHRWGDHRVLVTDSFWYHGPQTADVSAYSDPRFRDIDFSDIHYYPIPGQGADENLASQARDYNFHNSQVLNTAGPTPGTGCVALGFQLPRDSDPAQAAAFQDTAAPGQAVGLFIPLPNTFLGSGHWTLSCRYRYSPDAALAPGATHAAAFQVHSISMPNGYDVLTLPLTSGGLPRTWTAYSGQFTITSPTWQFNNGDCGIDFYCDAGTLAAGHVEMTDLRLTDPQGKVWYQNDFSDPSPADHWAAFSGRLLAPDLLPDGSPRLGKPLIDGECEVYGDAAYRAYGPNGASGAYATTDDPQDLMAEEAAWGELSPTSGILQFWEQAEAHNDNHGGWAYYAAVQKFLASAPAVSFADGKWKAANATTDDPQLCANYAQEDDTDHMAVAYVFNRQATWNALDTGQNIGTQSGNITFPHLTPGTYTIQYCSTDTGAVVGQQNSMAGESGLTVPLNGLPRDVALKIFPAH